MTNREVVRAQIESCNRFIRPGVSAAIGGFGGMLLSHALWTEGLAFCFALVGFLGVLVGVVGTVGLSIKVFCPKCHKGLSYLIFDPSYSGSYFPFGIIKDLPDTIEECPYCRADLR